ncbi:hypothetical protein BT96DRAFT_513566 [Gymnopus androsaceus JB14]|uniref:Uncharacterized protein n=1 Tax=Gymnopus androsaceus JB14 TaxID=1447944 RepID=A0A6A4GNC2_9AGAR|nr:hypothetical protein BT96DRAFT_513566 [Gymnopus androsaceus JB14]
MVSLLYQSDCLLDWGIYFLLEYIISICISLSSSVSVSIDIPSHRTRPFLTPSYERFKCFTSFRHISSLQLGKQVSGMVRGVVVLASYRL